MLGPAQAEFGFMSPSALPARHGGVWCYVDDVDAHCARARASGATILREPADQLYGVRAYDARDAEGHEWFFATPLQPEPVREARATKPRRARKDRKPGAAGRAASRRRAK